MRGVGGVREAQKPSGIPRDPQEFSFSGFLGDETAFLGGETMFLGDKTMFLGDETMILGGEISPGAPPGRCFLRGES